MNSERAYRGIAALCAVVLLLAGCSSDSSEEEPAEASWKQAPVVPEFDAGASAELRQQVARADRMGMRPDVFAKIGDSNTDFPGNLYGFGCRQPDFGDHTDLRSTWLRYRQSRLTGLPFPADCGPANPFTRDSTSAVSAAVSAWVLTPVGEMTESTLIEKPTGCRPNQTPVVCELGLLRPRYGMIMIGSGDVLAGMSLGAPFRKNLAEIVETTRAGGSVPVLSTLPPMEVETSQGGDGAERVEQANAVIAEVAAGMGVPLINVWRAMKEPGMKNDGLGTDNVHFSVFDSEEVPEVYRNSVDLTAGALAYGSNRRNLIWLQTLAELDRVAGL